MFFICLLSMILVFNQVRAQTERFSKIYCPQNVGAIGRHIVLTDTGYIAGGVAIDSISNIQTLSLTILNSYSEYSILPVSNNKKYFPGSAGSLFKTNDGSFIWAGQCRNQIKSYGFLIKFDKSLSKEWEKEYPFDTGNVYSYLGTLQVKQTRDSGFALIGEVEASGQYNTDILLIKTDSLGEKLWQKTYNFKGLDCGWNLIETPDKGFLLGGGGYVAGVSHSYSGLVIKTDSLGNEQWRKTIGSSFNDYYCVVSNSPDGNYITGTSTGVGIITPDESYRRIRLLKLNNQGVVIWDRMYSKQYAISALNNIVVLPNGDIVATGFYYPSNSQQTDTWGWILKTNSQGDSLWMREHYYFNGDANANRLYDIKQTPDGGFIACGEVDSMPAVPQSIWVLKLDSFGCLVPGCQNVGMMEVILQDNEQVFVFPNPANTEVNIRLPENFGKNAQQARLFDHLGREVLRQPLSSGEPTHTLNIASLPAGIYYIRIIGNGISVVAGRVVKK